MFRATSRWLVPFAAARVAAAALATVLLLLDGLPGNQGLLLLAALTYGPLTAYAVARSAAIRESRLAWLADVALVSVLVLWSGDWRSPFYLLWLTTLALPATILPARRAPTLAAGATVAFLAIAVVGGPVAGNLAPVSSETLAIHLALPAIVIAALAYAAEALRRLEIERQRSERLAIETERRRIGWELHDSAKQRLHAAHLIVSSLDGRVPAELDRPVQQAIAELESCAGEMDSSLAELRSPLNGRPLADALRERARELELAGRTVVKVIGSAPVLPTVHAAHTFRIATEAMTNAVRHADATRVDVVLERGADTFRVRISDNGLGLPAVPREQATGLLAMHSRAASMGASLVIIPRADGRGTDVILDGTAPTRGGRT